MQITVKQHIIPQFYQKYWSDSEGNVHFFDRSTGHVGAILVKKSEYSDYFYDSHSSYQPFETALRINENQVAPIIKRIIEEERINNINLNEKFLIATFIYFMFKRTRYEREKVTYARKKFKLSSKDKDAIRILHTHDMFSFDKIKQIISLFNLKWILLVNDTPSLFYTSDNPIIIQNHFAGKDDYLRSKFLYNIHYDDFTGCGIEVTIPLSPRLMLILYDPSLEDKHKTIPDMGKGKINERNARGLNLNTYITSFKNVIIPKSDCSVDKIDLLIKQRDDTSFFVAKYSLYDEYMDLNRFTKVYEELYKADLGNDPVKLAMMAIQHFEFKTKREELIIKTHSLVNHIIGARFDKNLKRIGSLEQGDRFVINVLSNAMPSLFSEITEEIEDIGHQRLKNNTEILESSYKLKLSQEPLTHPTRKSRENNLFYKTWIKAYELGIVKNLMKNLVENRLFKDFSFPFISKKEILYS
ncbi:MAG: DUF4238 domain-containing protein [Candidatus Hodarchaeota archaeon]